MLYLGNPCSPAVVDAMRAGLLGMLDSPYQDKHTPVEDAHAAGVTWAADNGAYASRWQAETWWAWLQGYRQLAHASSCLFATAPDVVADADATWERSRPWLEPIRALGYPVAYVAQDGLGWLPWDDLDVLFLGGSTAWKLGAEARGWAEAALERGKPVHMGRVNSERRWRYAYALGCSSVDGTFLTFGPARRLPEVLAWGRNLDQGALW